MTKPKKPKAKKEQPPVDFKIPEEVRDALESLRQVRERIDRYVAWIKSNPNSDGWIRLCEILKEAKEDKRVMSSKGASEFVELMFWLAMDALTASSADEALAPLTVEFQSSISRDMANKRHGKRVNIKEWVISEWIERKDEFKGNKSRFARRYKQRIKDEFNEPIEERQIRERWLKGI